MRKKAEESAPVTDSPKRPWTRVSEAEKSRIVASILNKEITISYKCREKKEGLFREFISQKMANTNFP